MAAQRRSSFSEGDLWDAVELFIKENEITCAETIGQCDWVAENSPDFLDKICGIVGWHPVEDDPPIVTVPEIEIGTAALVPAGEIMQIVAAPAGVEPASHADSKSGASPLGQGATRTVFDPFLGKEVEISSRLVDRLRGRYACGPTLPNGEPEFGWREFQTPLIQHAAADEIERLTKLLYPTPEEEKDMQICNGCGQPIRDEIGATKGT